MEYLGKDKTVNKIQPLVSVCVTAYNHEPYIQECLDSILNQETDFAYEIILGEDESSDSTREICKAYAEKYPDKIRLFLRSRKDVVFINGNATGRNNFIEGLKAARGKYIAICDGDDYWHTSEKLMMQKKAIEEHSNVNLVVSPWSSELGPFEYSKIKVKRISKKIETQRTPGHSSSAFFKKPEVFPNYLMETSAADRPLFNFLMDSGDALIISPPLTYYRVHNESIFSSLTPEQISFNHYHDLKIFYKAGKLSTKQYLKQAIKYETNTVKKMILRLLYKSIIFVNKMVK